MRPNTGVRLAAPIVFQQIELCYSLVSCTIPNLKSFLLNFDTSIGMTLGPETMRTYGSTDPHSANANSSFQLRSLRSRRGDKQPPPGGTTTTSTATLRPDPVDYRAQVGRSNEPNVNEAASSVSRDNGSDRSNGSQDMIIRREVAWNVHYD